MQKRDYYKRTIIGEIDGCSVYGQYYDDDHTPSVVGMNWNGWWIESDGAGVWFPTSGASVGHMSAADWARIKELAHTDVIERLIEMGRDWVTTPPLKRQLSYHNSSGEKQADDHLCAIMGLPIAAYQ